LLAVCRSSTLAEKRRIAFLFASSSPPKRPVLLRPTRLPIHQLLPTTPGEIWNGRRKGYKTREQDWGTRSGECRERPFPSTVRFRRPLSPGRSCMSPAREALFFLDNLCHLRGAQRDAGQTAEGQP
jgi:hypothetical protein